MAHLLYLLMAPKTTFRTAVKAERIALHVILVSLGGNVVWLRKEVCSDIG
jgi:hypothetical protein